MVGNPEVMAKVLVNGVPVLTVENCRSVGPRRNRPNSAWLEPELSIRRAGQIGNDEKHQQDQRRECC